MSDFEASLSDSMYLDAALIWDYHTEIARG